MFKILIKKQFMELFKGYFVNMKTGKVRSKKSLVGFFILFFMLFAVIGVSVYGTMTIFAGAFLGTEVQWLYFALAGLLTTGLGVFGSVFNTYASIYGARDNDLLLSLPIKSYHILITRIASVYLLGLLYGSAVYIPSLICFWIRVDRITAFNIIYPILILLFLGLLISAVTCVLGWLIALATSKIRNKNMITVALSLIFLGAYYFVMIRFNTLIVEIAQRSEELASGIKSFVAPFYWLGKGCIGDTLSFVLFFLFAFVCFIVVCFVMSKSFINLSTGGKSAKKKLYRDKTVKLKGVQSALLFKELKRFVQSPTYLMNCGLGVIIMIAVAVLAVIKKDFVLAYVYTLSGSIDAVLDLIPVIAVTLVCLLTSMNCISAPSVSLEGKNIWILQSLPVDTVKVLRAKVLLHFIMNTVPGSMLAIAVSYVLNLGVGYAIMFVLYVAVYNWFTGSVGVVLNLKMPNLTWTNETVPIKQSGPILISMFGGWALTMVISVIYYLVMNYISVYIFLGIVLALFVLFDVILDQWLRKKGTVIFDRL